MAVTILPFSNTEDFGPFKYARDLAEQEERLRLAKIQNQYKPDELRIANALKQNELDFAPKMSAAELAYKQASTPHLQAQTRGLDIANQFAPERLRLENIIKRNEADFAPRMSAADLAYRQASTPHLQAQTAGLEIANQFAPERLRLGNLQASQNLEYPGLDRGDFAATMAYLRDNPNKNVAIVPGRQEDQGPDEDYSMDVFPGSNNPFVPENKYEEMARQALLANASLSDLGQLPVIPGMYQPGIPQQSISDLLTKKFESDLDYKNAMSDRLKNPISVSRFGGVKTQYMDNLKNALKQNNPNFTDEQVDEALNKTLDSIPQLNDGTPIDSSGAAGVWADYIKSGSIGGKTAASIIDARASEVELQSLNETITKYTDGKGYNATLLGQNFKLLSDAASNNPKRQESAAEWIAGRIMTNEGINLQIKLANAKNTVHAISSIANDMLKQDKQWFPIVSEEVRPIVRKKLEEGLRKAFEERLKFKGSITKSLQNELQEDDNKDKKQKLIYDPATGRFVNANR